MGHTSPATLKDCERPKTDPLGCTGRIAGPDQKVMLTVELTGAGLFPRPSEAMLNALLYLNFTKVKKMKKIFAVVLVLVVCMALTACNDDATVAKHNMQKAADNFEIMRRVVMYNAIIGQPIMVTEGRCSVDNDQYRTSIVCKIGEGQYIRNFYGKSDNVSYLVEQMAPVPVSVYHYRRTFKPQSVLPDIDFRGDMKALGSAITLDVND